MREIDLAHAPRLVDLGQHVVQADAAGIGFEVLQRQPPGVARVQPVVNLVRRTVVRLDRREQRVDARQAVRPAAREQALVQVVFVGAQGRAEQAVDAPGRRRLDVPAPAPRVDGGLQLLEAVLVRQYVLTEPGGEVVDVPLRRLAEPERLPDLRHLLHTYVNLDVNRRLAEPERLPDLRAMVGDGAAVPLVPRVEFRREVELLRDVDDGRGRDIALVRGEAPLILEVLEEEREAQVRRARLVRQQLSVAAGEGPVFRQFVRRPLPLHAAPP